MGPIRTRGNDRHFWRVCLAASLAVSLAGCSAGMPSLPSIKNPFAKAEEKLPGERVAVITDQSLEPADPALAAKPIALPPAVANAAWSDPGGTPSNSLGHLAIGERVNKSWRVDIGTGSSSSGRLSAVPIVADGKVFTLDAGGTVSAFSAAGGCKGLVDKRDAEEREAGGRLRRRTRARQRAALCHHGIWHRGRHRSRQGQRAVDAEDRRAGALIADGGRRQGLFRVDRQRVALPRRQ